MTPKMREAIEVNYTFGPAVLSDPKLRTKKIQNSANIAKEVYANAAIQKNITGELLKKLITASDFYNDMITHVRELEITYAINRTKLSIAFKRAQKAYNFLQVDDK